MACHDLACLVQRSRLGDGAVECLMQLLALATRNIVRVLGYLPRALVTLPNPLQFPAHSKSYLLPTQRSMTKSGRNPDVPRSPP